MTDSRIAISAPSLPKGGGALRGIGESFQPQEFTGAASLSIPVPNSPCRGFEPRLSVDYSSGAGNGVFGLGFALSIPGIARKTSKGIPKYDDSDVFLLSGAEDLVPVPGGHDDARPAGSDGYSVVTYRPRAEGLFARIEHWSKEGGEDSYWRVVSRDNLTSVYGEDAQARICDPENPDRVYQWLLQETFDDKGNLILYEYKSENADEVPANTSEKNRAHTANKYLERIRYGNDRALTAGEQEPGHRKATLRKINWHFEVVFDYGEPGPDPKTRYTTPAEATWACRKDSFSSFKAGFEIRTHRLCRRILMFHRFEHIDGGNPFLVNATHFNYESQSGISFLTSVTHVGYRDGAAKEMPPLEFAYTKSQPRGARSFKPLELESGNGTDSWRRFPGLLENGSHRMVDLYGEGLPGILYTDAAAVLYWPPLGGGRFAPGETPRRFPVERNLQNAAYVLTDLEGDGKLDLVVTTPTRSGYYESHPDGSWEPFRNFAAAPTELLNSQREMVDVTGDGRADLLLFEPDAVKVYASKGKLGYERLQKRPALNRLPVGGHPSRREAIRFADMFGDGGSHLVRISNGSVQCWPNLGYGRFGPKIEFDNAPLFGNELDAGRLFLTDIDGSGTTDLVYAHPDRIDVYRNESGNGFSGPESIPLARPYHELSRIGFADVLGNGTACLVFTSVNDDLSLDHQYYDFTGGVKPHLLNRVDNNMGATTLIRYAPSTKFYLADEKAGTPWVTRLPFPVQVVERIDTIDHIGGSAAVAEFTYHHGYFDPIDREFRGFGRVERQDAETFNSSTKFGQAYDVPPTLTKTWYHTGAYAEAGAISQRYAAEFYKGDNRAQPLPDSALDPAFRANPENMSEACRAMHGVVLRVEAYGLDQELNPHLSAHPYTVTESSYYVRLVQPKAGRPHAVCFVEPRETITYHYERNPADPRIGHTLTLEVDAYGNVLKEAFIGYGRRRPDKNLSPADQANQNRALITYTEREVTNAVDTAGAHRTPLPAATRTFELTGYGFEEWTRDSFALLPPAADIPYEQAANNTTPQRRLIGHTLTLYRPDDLGASRQNDPLALLPLGELEPLALPGESYQLALTPGLLGQIYEGKLPPDPASVLEGAGGDKGGYRSSQSLRSQNLLPPHSSDLWRESYRDGHWWIPSGRLFLSAQSGDKAAEELRHARGHFFLPHRTRDAFHGEHFVTYDAYDLLPAESLDALGNRVTVGERDASGNLDPTAPGNDYRVLQPRLVTDANGNRAAVSFDALGMVVGTAAMGKPAPAPVEGDSLDGFEADLPDAVILDHLSNPLADPHAILGRATTRLVYDLFAFQRTRDQPIPQPAVVYTVARETHDAELAPGRHTRLHHSFSYSDGFGREIQKKAQAEPGPVPVRDANRTIIVGADGQPELTANDVSPRWVGTGWTVFNNKGRPVRQYEPFLTDSHRFEFGVKLGVSSVLFYDPVERVTATLHPNHTWEKVVFDAWRQETWDVNDTALVADPGTDADVGGFFGRLPDSDYLPTWYALRTDAANAAGFAARYPDATRRTNETRAAEKTLAHAATPAVAHCDPLGRVFLTVTHNKYRRGDTDLLVEEFHPTRVVQDIEGNHRELIDAAGRVAMRGDYDMLGNPIHEAGMDAGERWMLHDAAGNPLRAWDSRGHRFRTDYDPLRRPLRSFVAGADPATPARELLTDRLVYGEQHPEAERRNLRGRLYLHLDQAGAVAAEEHDFKGNVLLSSRRLATTYKQALDWGKASAALPARASARFDPAALESALAPSLEAEIYTSRTRYDALDRPTELTAPDNSVIRPTYNEANLVERVEVNLRGATVVTPLVTNIDYDAKGQRTRIDYGNGVRTTYEYEPETFHLSRLKTTRPTAPAALQDLSYTYDPAGNITHIHDAAQQAIYFRNQRVEPSADYTYDAVYRLIEATGREHLGQVGGAPGPYSSDDVPRVGLPHPGDGDAMGAYTERYVYDAVGNFLQVQHRGSDPAQGWTRGYEYNHASPLEPARRSNRLSSTAAGDGDPSPERYDYDAHGNMTVMPHLPLMRWDYREQLQATARQVVNNGGTPEITYYVYDAGGQRVRQVTEREAAAGRPARRKAERIYLGGFEIYREYKNGGETVALERETLHVMDDQRPVALVETRTKGKDEAPPQLIRYQFENHLGSASLELDERAQIISYEEYSPFGSTSYQAVRSRTETPKRYRYSGKERDDSTGLYYYGARYYAPWLGRWTSPDPAGTVDGLNLYEFVVGNPINHVDIGGMGAGKPEAVGKRVGKRKEIQSSPYRVNRLIQRHTGTGRNIFTMKVKPKNGGLPIYITMLSLGLGKTKLKMSAPFNQRRRGHTEGVAAAILAARAVTTGRETIKIEPEEIEYFASTNEPCSGKGSEQCMDEVIPELQTLAPNAEVYYQNEYKTGQKQGKGFMKAANEHFDSGNRSDEESEEEARYFVVSELSDDYKNQEDEPVPLKVESLEDYLGKDPKKNPQIIKSAKRRKPHQYLNSERKVYKEQSKNQKKKQEKGSLFKLLQRVRGKK